jgi:hypothetical protein
VARPRPGTTGFLDAATGCHGGPTGENDRTFGSTLNNQASVVAIEAPSAVARLRSPAFRARDAARLPGDDLRFEDVELGPGDGITMLIIVLLLSIGIGIYAARRIRRTILASDECGYTIRLELVLRDRESASPSAD